MATTSMLLCQQTARILEQRQTVLVPPPVHPERFVRSASKPLAVPTQALINKPLQIT